jgi:hypothetical protein
MVMEILIQGSCCKIIMRNKNMEKKFARKSWWTAATLGQNLFPLEKGCQSYLKIKASREN